MNAHKFADNVAKLAREELHLNRRSAWKAFTIKVERGRSTLDTIRKHIQGQSKNRVPGLYAFYARKKCWYVGQSQDISYRIYHHIRTAHLETGAKRWQEFFEELRDKKVAIKWCMIPLHKDKRVSKFIREIFETQQSILMKPIFLQEDE